MIERTGKLFSASCDECVYSEESLEAETLAEAKKEIIDAGWLVVTENGKSRHFCSVACYDKFKHEEL